MSPSCSEAAGELYFDSFPCSASSYAFFICAMRFSVLPPASVRSLSASATSSSRYRARISQYQLIVNCLFAIPVAFGHTRVSCVNLRLAGSVAASALLQTALIPLRFVDIRGMRVPRRRQRDIECQAKFAGSPSPSASFASAFLFRECPQLRDCRAVVIAMVTSAPPRLVFASCGRLSRSLAPPCRKWFPLIQPLTRPPQPFA